MKKSVDSPSFWEMILYFILPACLIFFFVFSFLTKQAAANSNLVPVETIGRESASVSRPSATVRPTVKPTVARTDRETTRPAETITVNKPPEGWQDLRALYELFRKPAPAPQAAVASLKIFLKEQIVAAFSINAAGEEELLRAFPCSSGYIDGHTPLGKYQLGMQMPEAWLFDNSLAQCGFQITGNILFHSLPSYDGSLNSGLKISDLNAIGYPASHGCVRLYYRDARWIFDYCPPGTTVDILTERGETYSALPAHLYYLRLKEGAPTWDPSDPDPENPYLDWQTWEKWAIPEPWKESFTPLPPVWPESNPVVEEVAPPTASHGGQSLESSSTEKAAATTPAITWETSPLPLENNPVSPAENQMTSPPPLP